MASAVAVAAFPVMLPVIGFVTVKFISVPTLVSDDVTTFAAKVVPVSVPAGAITTFVEAAVTKPFPFTVNDGIAVEEPKLPTFEFTVASVAARVPDVVMSPDKSPFVIDEPPENFVKFPVAGDPVVVTVPDPPLAVRVPADKLRPEPTPTPAKEPVLSNPASVLAVPGATLIVPLVVIGPPVRPVPVFIWVTEPAPEDSPVELL